MKYTSTLLKAALFATGLAGIVSEYTLSTLATYFLGDSVFQWTMIVSIMLFSMGLGSRISKGIKDTSLFERFILIEFSLSILASNITVIVYTFYALYGNTVFIIYLLCIVVGLMIGMEIPIVIRLNQQFESLKVNISSALENDYYGSLAGGVFFAFIGLPILGLTYTPLILGILNYLVAMVFLVVIWKEIEAKARVRYRLYASFVVIVLALTATFSNDVVRWGDKIRYKDRVIYSEQTRYQKIVLTYAEGDYWFFLNGNQQLSTFDEALYHEPLVHPALLLHNDPKNVLVLGGGDGAAVRELIKYEAVERIVLVDLDPRVTDLAKSHPILLSINQHSLEDDRVEVINQDGFKYLEQTEQTFDIVIADFPDPRTVDLGRLYSLEFYWLCGNVLNRDGLLVTQAGSPYYAQRAYECIEKTIQSAGFTTLPLHNQVMTLGQWGWIIGSISPRTEMKEDLTNAKLTVPTQWMTNESLAMITSFGKRIFPKDYEVVEINRLHNPVLYKYYLGGRWDVY